MKGSVFIWADLFRRGKNPQSEAIISALRANHLFKPLSSSELQYLSQLVHERIYEKGETIFKQNDRGYGLYVILSGNVSIRARSPQGEVQVTTLERGSFFGELALIEEDNIRTAGAIALERTALLGFFKPDLLEILERKPETGVKILLQLAGVLGRRLMATTERVNLALAQENPRVEKPNDPHAA